MTGVQSFKFHILLNISYYLMIFQYNIELLRESATVLLLFSGNISSKIICDLFAKYKLLNILYFLMF